MDKAFITHQIETIHESIEQLKHQHHINHPIDICVASKYATAEEIRFIHSQGLSIFGENKVQDALKKQQDLMDLDINWQFIGHLQSNKVNKVIKQFNCIQSIDRLDLLEHVNDKSLLLNTKKEILIQFNSGDDPNKFGFSLDNQDMLIDTLHTYTGITLKGIMLIAPLLDNDKELGLVFEKTKKAYDTFKQNYGTLSVLSMGMSQDYKLAISCGSNMVRIGRFIFKK